MQRINYKEKILLEENIKELLIINIDDKLNQTKESDCVKISGEIKISGEVSTNNGNKNFYHPVSVDIMLSEEQLVAKEVQVSIEDFNYQVDNNYINIDLIMKIDGLKEIEPYFPAQEDQEVIQIDRHEEAYEDESVDSDIKSENIEDVKEEIIEAEESSIKSDNEEIHDQQAPEQQVPIEQESREKENYSLLKQVFKYRNIKKETSHIYHVVKKETSYADIASKYGISEEVIKQVNNDEEIYEGKLVLIPKI